MVAAAQRTPREEPDVASSTDAYAARFSGSTGAFFLDLQLDAVLRSLPSPSNCRVLDLGGGHAQLAAPLVSRGYDVTVLGSEESCRERLDAIVGSDRYAFRRGSLLEPPFDTESFDVVLALRLLPHLDDWRRFIEGACRVCSGTIVLDYPEKRSANRFADPLFWIKRAIEKNTRRYRCFRLQEIETALQHHGFAVESCWAQFLCPMALHRLVGHAGLSRRVESAARSLGLTQRMGSPVIVAAARGATAVDVVR